MYGMLALQRHVLISLLSFLAQNRTERGSDFLVSEVLRKSRLFILTVGTLFHAVDTPSATSWYTANGLMSGFVWFCQCVCSRV